MLSPNPQNNWQVDLVLITIFQVSRLELSEAQ